MNNIINFLISRIIFIQNTTMRILTEVVLLLLFCAIAVTSVFEVQSLLWIPMFAFFVFCTLCMIKAIETVECIYVTSKKAQEDPPRSDV